MFTLNVNVILLYRAYLITFSFSQMAIDKFNSELKVSTYVNCRLKVNWNDILKYKNILNFTLLVLSTEVIKSQL